MHRKLVVALCLLVAAALVVAWWFVPSVHSLDPATVASYRATLQVTPFAPLVAVVLYVVLGFVAAPASLMIGATLLCFGTTRGLAYAYLGMLANGCAVRGVTRSVGRDRVLAWLAHRSGSRVAALQRLAARRGVAAVMAMRLTPVPYTLQNVIAGVADVRLRDFLVGTVIGLVPVMAIMAGVTSQFDAWLDSPDLVRTLVLGGGVLAGAFALAWLARSRRSD